MSASLALFVPAVMVRACANDNINGVVTNTL